MDGIQNPNPQPGSALPPKPEQPQGLPKFTPPPQIAINMRTPESDLRSIQRGDAAPVPESVLPPENPKEPVFRPETQVAYGETELQRESSPGMKKMLFWVIVGIGVVVVGGIGYFVVYPLLFPPASDEGQVTVPPPPASEPIAHQTLFIGSPAATTEVLLPDLTHATISANLSSVAAFKLPAGTVQEVVVKDLSGSQVPFKNFMNAFAPVLTVDGLSGWFEDDFTSFIYYDDAGAWPGVIARVKTGVNLTDAEAALAAIEGADLSGFYLASPGVFDPFKDGKIKEYQTRYARASAPGASFNYGFGGNFLLVSSSYDGLKAAIGLLGI